MVEDGSQPSRPMPFRVVELVTRARASSIARSARAAGRSKSYSTFKTPSRTGSATIALQASSSISPSWSFVESVSSEVSVIEEGATRDRSTATALRLHRNYRQDSCWDGGRSSSHRRHGDTMGDCRFDQVAVESSSRVGMPL